MTERKQRAAQLQKILADRAKKKKIHSTDESPQYLTYKQPDQLYQIDYPAHWRITQPCKDDPKVEGCVRFVSNDPTGTAVELFRAMIPLSTEQMAKTGMFVEVVKMMFKEGRSTEFSSDPTIIYPNVVANRTEEGEAGKRYVVMAADVYVAISTCVLADQQETVQPIIERMLSSFRVHRDDQVLAVKMVRSVLLQLAEALPNVKFEHDGRLNLKSSQMKLTLGNLFTELQRNPAHFDEQVGQVVQGIKSTYDQINGIASQTWADVQAKIQPLIKTDTYLQDANLMTQRKGKPNGEDARATQIPFVRWMADLCICYGVDDVQTFRLVSDTDLKRWGVSMDEIHEAAMLNLNTLPEPEILVLGISESLPKLGSFKPSGGAVSSYVLRNDFYGKAVAAVGSNAIVALPTRDALMIFGEKHEHDILKQAVKKDFDTSAYALSDRLFRSTPDGIALL